MKQRNESLPKFQIFFRFQKSITAATEVIINIKLSANGANDQRASANVQQL